MIDADRAARAVQYLIDSAAEYGAAKAEAARRDDMLRVIKALVMAQSNQSSAAAQEREAYASQRYQDAVAEKFEAVKASETLRASREAAIQTIEFWRSANANQRAAERGYGSAK
jgi:hypothetical protein